MPDKSASIAVLAVLGLASHALLRWTPILAPEHMNRVAWPLFFVLIAGGVPLVFELLKKLLRREFGSDLLAGISIVTSVLLEEYLAGSFVVLMLAGGEAVEAYAVRRASSVLEALAKRMPKIAHRKIEGRFEDVPLEQVAVGELLVVLPHESCPVDATVVEGHGSMDESYLTGEPYRVSKAPGTTVLSGAINGDSALTIRADRPAIESRYAKIMQVMRESEQRRPRLRRLGDQLGAIYTPVAVVIAVLAWWLSGDARRFLAVLVVATPCPLLIAIPVAIIGAISLAAKRGIIVRDPAILEKIDTCRTAIFDKTGTLTYGRPDLIEVLPAPGFDRQVVLADVAGLERYSKHPLATAVLTAAEKDHLVLSAASEVSEPPGAGMSGKIGNRRILITSRKFVAKTYPNQAELLPPIAPGMECIVVVDDRYTATLRFRDLPRSESKDFVSHLRPRHHLDRVLLVSGDRASEVNYLAELVGIREVFSGQSPEQKLELVRRETALAPTIFLGDGINDAPALTAATVGIAIGGGNDVLTEAAGAVILETSMTKVDELLHISIRLKKIALQSAIGGMALSVLGMGLAALGYLPPVTGAIVQELIDLAAVLNAMRTSIIPSSSATDMRR
ncbi:MAG: heavy metal translocating P-type ATPase [Planctomycetia bacterium]|nr:heavy metal translocating P-type ATPase [Planctomycetia bacterium]